MEANVQTISDSLAEIKQAIRDLAEQVERSRRDLTDRMDKLILWGCSTMLGIFMALSIQLWLKR